MKQRLTRSGSLLYPSELGTTPISAKPRPRERWEKMGRVKEIEKVKSSNRGSGGSSGRTRKPYVFVLESIRELIFFFKFFLI